MSDDQLIKSPLYKINYIPYYNDNYLRINTTNIFTQCTYYKDFTPLRLHISNFSISHLNIRSIPKKFDSLTDYLHYINVVFSVGDGGVV